MKIKFGMIGINGLLLLLYRLRIVIPNKMVLVTNAEVKRFVNKWRRNYILLEGCNYQEEIVFRVLKKFPQNVK
ncbi:MAG: hypothetical protein LH473_02695 [Chitinophagales bacterium]|nr:hypothetical protein [Chitinophagales bacterium]